MSENQLNKIDRAYVRICLQANQHNALTAYYYLTLKKRVIQGELLDDNVAPSSSIMPKDRQTKKFQSIEPQRTSLYNNEKNKYQLRKVGDNLNDLHIARIQATDAAISRSILSPQTNPPKLSPDELLLSRMEQNGLISPALQLQE